MTKLFLTAVVCTFTSLSFAQSIDGKYKVDSIICKSGTPTNPTIVATAKMSLLELSAGKLTLTVDIGKYVPNCVYTTEGTYEFTGNQLKMKYLSSSATKACDAEPDSQEQSEIVATVTLNENGFTMESLNTKGDACPIGDTEIDSFKLAN
jgi:hypothetical protein